jgi:polyisoprenyl-phosphate glycosyltransferase
MMPARMPDTTGKILRTLTVVAPCYNEREIIGNFAAEVLRAADELRGTCAVRVLIVDDGSSDGSPAILDECAKKDARVSWIGLARNFGHQAAITAGIDHVREGAVLTMDSDLEHPPSLIPAMVKHWLAGSGVVCGVREQPQGLSKFKAASSALFYTVFNALSDTKLQPGSADFILLGEDARAALQAMPEHHRFIRAMVAWIGFPRTFVPYLQPARPAGKSKYTTRRMLRLALQGVLSFSTRPIYWMFGASLLLTAAGLIYLFYILWVALVEKRTVQGWASVLGVLLILGGWLTFVCSTLGLYIAKIFEQVKNRPTYIVRRFPERGTNE